MIRALLLTLVGLLFLLQYRLWLGEGGIRERQMLSEQVVSGEASNTALRTRNEALANRVIELQDGKEMLEAVAREELGLVRDGEEYILFVNEENEDKSP